MNESERRPENIQQQKDRIRRRYQGTVSKKVRIIPVTAAQPDFDDDSTTKRVAVYARVSTGDLRQTSSYELQKNYYESQVQKHPNWTLVSIYADEGLSGTSIQKRKEFNRMIEDCKAGKIDLILTKSISRFARNYVDCGQIVRELMDLNPPVGVHFESENLFTLKMQGEMQLMMFSGIAQEESRIKSNAMNASIEMRFGCGIYLTPPLLGYDRDEEGNLVINEKEAKIVRLIFFLYLYGYTCQQIADTLTQLGCQTKKGNTVWSAGSILGVLRNERHCGAVQARKTFTPNYLNHKSRKNRGDRLSYFAEDQHEPIITPEDYFAVQKLLSNAKYGGRGILPELHTITEGALQGYVAVNPRWAGFEAEDYQKASLRTCGPPIDLEPVRIEIQPGDFDLRGFEVVRAQFFQTVRTPCITLSIKGIHFNCMCIHKLGGTKFVELLVHPGKRMFAVRPAEENGRHSLYWARLTGNGKWMSKTVSGAAFLPTLYQLLGWKTEYKYCMKGICRHNQEGSILLFRWEDAEILIPDRIFGDASHRLFRSAARRAIAAFPSSWVDSMGVNWYAHFQTQESAATNICGDWGFMVPAKPPSGGSDQNFIASKTIAEGIQNLIPQVRREGAEDGG